MTTTNDHRAEPHFVSPHLLKQMDCPPPHAVEGQHLGDVAIGVSLNDGDVEGSRVSEGRTDRSVQTVWPRADWATEFEVEGGVARRYRRVQFGGEDSVALVQAAELKLGFDGTPNVEIDETKIVIHQQGSVIGDSLLTLTQARQLLNWSRSDQQVPPDSAVSSQIPVGKLPFFRAGLQALLNAYDQALGEGADGEIPTAEPSSVEVTWPAPAWATSINYEGPASTDRDGIPYDITQWFGLMREIENGYISAEGCLGLDPKTHTLTFAVDTPRITYAIQDWPASSEVSIEEARSMVVGESDDRREDLESSPTTRETLRQLLDAYDSSTTGH